MPRATTSKSTPPAKTKAEGRSISFSPLSLHTMATEYGESLDPPRNVSNIVCEAVREYLAKRGVTDASTQPHQEILATVAGVLKRRPEFAPKLKEFLHVHIRNRKAA